MELIDIFNNNGASLDFEEDICFEDEEFLGTHVSFENPMHIKGKAENIGGCVEIFAHVTGKADTVCARCMKDIVEDVDFSFVEHVVSKSGTEAADDDVILIEGSEVDITDIALNNFLTLSPMRYLCKEDCKGLCAHCGADKNISSCSCEDQKTDARFDILDDLFKK